MKITFTVPGKPQGKGRPRYTKSGQPYTPASTRRYECLIKEAYRMQSGYRFPEDKALEVRCYVMFPIPKSTTRKVIDLIKRLLLLPTKKPDVDNIAKAVLDALNGVAYADDSQVTDLVFRKRYAGADPRSVGLIVTITDEVQP